MMRLGNVVSVFQSTHPVRGATQLGRERCQERVISIHAPREGCDAYTASETFNGPNFNPRTP